MVANYALFIRAITLAGLVYQNLTYQKLNSNEQIANFTVLIWTKWYDYEFGDEFDKNSCESTNCQFTRDRMLIEESDAVIFHQTDIDLYDIPRKQANQKWILYNTESP